MNENAGTKSGEHGHGNIELGGSIRASDPTIGVQAFLLDSAKDDHTRISEHVGFSHSKDRRDDDFIIRGTDKVRIARKIFVSALEQLRVTNERTYSKAKSDHKRSLRDEDVAAQLWVS